MSAAVPEALSPSPVCACVVSMGDENDRLLGPPRYHGHDVEKLDLAEIDEIRAPDVLLRLEPERRDRLRVPAGGVRGLVGAGHSGGELGRELARDRGRHRRVEHRLELRAGKRSCCREREQDGEDDRCEDERADADETRVERSVDGAAARPPPPPTGTSRFHRGASVGGLERRGRRCRGASAAARGGRVLEASATAPMQNPLDHPPRRRRGVDPDAAHVPARARRVSRRPVA